MKFFRILLLIVLTFIVSGCVATYELEIDGDKFNEKITTYIYNSDRENATYDDEFTASRIDAFVERDVYPYFENYQNTFEKKVNKTENYEQVILKYKYSAEEYKNSNAINLCFHNKNFEINDKYYNIELNGYFYCLYDNDVVNIEIITDNEVISHNAHEQQKNKYIWKINKTNFQNVDIKMQVGKQNKKNIIYITIGIIIFIVLGLTCFAITRKKISDINKI